MAPQPRSGRGGAAGGLSSDGYKLYNSIYTRETAESWSPEGWQGVCRGEETVLGTAQTREALPMSTWP